MAHPSTPLGHCTGGFANHEFVYTSCAEYEWQLYPPVYPPLIHILKKIFRASVFVRAGSSGHSARSSTTPSKYWRDGKLQHPISVLLSRVARKSPLLVYVDSCALYCSLLTPRLPRYAASKLDVVYGMSSYNAPLNGPPWKVYPDNGTINGAYQNTT